MNNVNNKSSNLIINYYEKVFRSTVLIPCDYILYLTIEKSFHSEITKKKKTQTFEYIQLSYMTKVKES